MEGKPHYSSGRDYAICIFTNSDSFPQISETSPNIIYGIYKSKGMNPDKEQTNFNHDTGIGLRLYPEPLNHLSKFSQAFIHPQTDLSRVPRSRSIQDPSLKRTYSLTIQIANASTSYRSHLPNFLQRNGMSPRRFSTCNPVLGNGWTGRSLLTGIHSCAE